MICETFLRIHINLKNIYLGMTSSDMILRHHPHLKNLTLNYPKCNLIILKLLMDNQKLFESEVQYILFIIFFKSL